jgi:hypothetical protein
MIDKKISKTHRPLKGLGASRFVPMVRAHSEESVIMNAKYVFSRCALFRG